MGSLVLSNSTTSRRECMHLLPKVYLARAVTTSLKLNFA
jgi:hypothetical protein